MPVGHLWYIRRGEQQRGPYPTAVMERNIGLGRILATDLLSADGNHWLAATDFPDFELHQRSPETGLARQLEERQHERRTSGEAWHPPGSRPPGCSAASELPCSC